MDFYVLIFPKFPMFLLNVWHAHYGWLVQSDVCSWSRWTWRCGRSLSRAEPCTTAGWRATNRRWRSSRRTLWVQHTPQHSTIHYIQCRKFMTLFTEPCTQTQQKMYSLFKTQFFEGHHSLPRLILSVFIKLCWAWGAQACASPCPCLVIHKSYLPSPLTSNLNEGLALRNWFLFCFAVMFCPLCSYVHLFL